MNSIIIMVAVLAILIILSIGGILSRFRKCKSNELLVVYGRTSGKDAEGAKVSCKVYHGGAAFVWPVIQGYEVMSMEPRSIKMVIKGLSSQSIPTTIPVALTTAISKTPAIMQNAAERLLGMDSDAVSRTIGDIMEGEVRAIMATMPIEDINSDREKFLTKVRTNIETELNKIGYSVVNINISDIKDDANYIVNLGKKAATQAQAQAEADIAEQEKVGAIKIAITKKERDIAVADAEKIRLSTVADTEKEKAKAIALAEKEKTIALAEISKENATAIANQEKEREVSIAQAKAEQESKIAEQEAIKTANVAKSQAEAEAKKEEAEAEKQIRIKNAEQHRDAENIKAEQDKEAKASEYASAARRRQALAEQEAGVAEQKATIEVSKAKAEAAKAKADAEKVAGVSHVEAEMQVAKTKQERQIEVNEAAAKAQEKKLYAEQVVPAEAAKKRLVVEAEALKAKAILAAEADKEARIREAEADAEKIRRVKDAEAEGTKKILLAEAEGLRAAAQVEVDKQKGLSEAEVAGMLQLGHEMGDPNAALQFYLREVNRDIKVAEAYAGSLHDMIGNVTVYGDTKTAGDMASNLLSLIPKIKQMVSALGEGVSAAKEAFKGKVLPAAAPAALPASPANTPTPAPVHKQDRK